MTDIDLNALAELQHVAAEADESDSGELYTVSYRHKRVRNFCMGKVTAGRPEFEFKNNTLTIGPLPAKKLVDAVERFKVLWNGLQPADKHAIVRLRNVQNEVGVEDLPAIHKPGGGAIRGPVSTSDSADKATVEAAPPAAKVPSFMSTLGKTQQ